MEVYRRRSRLTGRGIRRRGNIDYSYAAHNFQPLGMQLYLRHIHRGDWPMASLTEATPRPRLPGMAEAGASDTIERTTYQVRQRDSGNPYNWEIDACSIVLGNFNSRKMSLVRDYDQLLAEEERSTPVFDDLFTARPRDRQGLNASVPAWPQRFDVVPSDPTQAKAVATAAQGQSFIIQGPPGTGKSQTITNLIADAVGRGQRVLFVCEKRAALDVVFHRLRQQGLDRLSCLIHDTQEDKKPFIADLKNTYEQFCEQHDDYEHIEQERQAAAQAIERGKEQLQRWSDELNAVDDQLTLSPLAAIRQLVALDGQLPDLSEEDNDALPNWPQWQECRKTITATRNGPG